MVPPNNHKTSPKLAAKPKTKSVRTAAAVGVADRRAIDTSPRASPTDSDPGADKAAELCSNARPTGLAKDMGEEEEGQSNIEGPNPDCISSDGHVLTP